jgi:DNA-binding CsgD family transcriptional regulator
LGDAYATAYFGIAGAYAALGNIAEARQAYRRAREAYGLIGHHYMIGMAIEQELNVVVLPYLADDRAEREAVAAAAERSLARASGAMAAQSPRIARLLLLLVTGAWDEAQELATAGRASGIDLVAQRALAVLAYERGNADAAWEIVRALLPSGPATEPGTTFLATTLVLQRVAAALCCDANDFAAARTWLEAQKRLLDWSSCVPGRAECDRAWAQYALASGDLSAARDHAIRALASATQLRQPLVLLAAHRLLGEIATVSGDAEMAGTHLAEALALAEACAAPYDRALIGLAQAEWHIAMGKFAEAGAAIADARAICTSLQATRALARADRVQAALAAHLPPACSPQHARRPDGLTRRELEVLRLIGTGASNREIADQLSISIRTIERHITNLYRKIDARGKADATVYLFRHDLG